MRVCIRSGSVKGGANEKMKQLLLTTIAAVVLVGCGPSVDIHEAAKTGNIKAVKQHLAGGVDVNVKNKNGQTPLHRSVSYDCREIINLLVANGADVNEKAKYGGTPLMYAASNGNKEIAELLIAAGAEVNANDGRGSTPLDNAIYAKKTEVADILRKHGGKTGEELKAEGK